MKVSRIQVIVLLFLSFFGGNFLSADQFSNGSLVSAPQPRTKWTIFGYAQAKNDLSTFLPKNLQDMATIGSNQNVTVIFELHEPGKQGTYRYKINKDNIELVYSDPNETHTNSAKSLVDGATWTFKNFPSVHTGLVFWGHASGIVDPKDWSNHFARYRSPDEITEEDIENYNRGILFNWEQKKYMTNQEMVTALKAIGHVDVIGMDTCFMSMLEVAYQVRKHARYLVSSQEVVHALGWSYKEVIAGLNAYSRTPDQCVKLIVSTFGDYYKNKLSWYTQSAIDLTKMDLLKENLDQIVSLVFSCKQKYGTCMRELIMSARKTCLQFNSPGYIDLHSFYVELHNQISSFIVAQSSKTRGPSEEEGEFSEFDVRKVKKNYKKKKDWRRQPPIFNSFTSPTQELEALKEQLFAGMKLIETAVVANATGHGMKRARGISIYFPLFIDPSYTLTEFAQQSSWIHFLKSIL